MHMFGDLELTLKTNADMAHKGKEYWERLRNDISLKNNHCVLLFPSSDKNVNAVSVKYLRQLLGRYGYEKAVVLYVDKAVTEYLSYFSDCIEKEIEVSQYDSDCLLMLYALFDFSHRFYVCSLTQPEGRGEEMLHNWNFSLDEMICVGIYRIYDYVYLGENGN